jgi:hypothetical protein
MIENMMNHIVTYIRKVESGKDDYNQPTYTETTKTSRCFYDIPRREITFTEDDTELRVEAVLFMPNTADIATGDEITKVEDANGNNITTQKLRVAAINSATTPVRVNHLEVNLAKA